MSVTTEYRWGGLSLGLWTLLATPLARSVLEASLLGHLLIQMPLLVMAGLGMSRLLPRSVLRPLSEVNQGGIPGLLAAVFAAAFWMLPRSIDASLVTGTIEAAKFVTLPLLVGMALGLSWSRLSTVARGFVLGNVLSMLAFLGWFYLSVPARLCNFYLVDDQVWLGRSLLALAAVVAVPFVYRAFAGPGRLQALKAGSDQVQLLSP